MTGVGTSPAEEKKEREEKKMTLFRKLSFRPTVDELKARKVCLLPSNFIFLHPIFTVVTDRSRQSTFIGPQSLSFAAIESVETIH